MKATKQKRNRFSVIMLLFVIIITITIGYYLVPYYLLPFIFSFDLLPTEDRNCQNMFLPNSDFDINYTVDSKMKALEAFNDYRNAGTLEFRGNAPVGRLAEENFTLEDIKFINMSLNKGMSTEGWVLMNRIGIDRQGSVYWRFGCI